MKYVVTNKADTDGSERTVKLPERTIGNLPFELSIGNIFTERYTREEAHPIAGYITEFLNWLELHGYMDRYKEKWAVIEN